MFFYKFINYLLTAFLLIAPTVYFLFILYSFREIIKKSLPQIFLLLLLTTVFLNKLLFTDLTLAQKDFNNIQIPFFAFFYNSITKYFLPPILNSSFCGGFNNFSNPLAGYFSVFNWIFLLTKNIYYNFHIFIFIQIFLCGLFSFFMLRTFKFSKNTSLLGAVVFTFNGFITMRLSPGVGIEYIFAYKWLPLIFAFSYKYLKDFKKIDLLSLGIVFAFSLEGNPNLAIANGVLLIFFLLFRYKDVLKDKFRIVFAPIVAFLVYAIKVIPSFENLIFSDANVSFLSEGWRGSNFDLYMYPEIFFPIKSDFTNGVFTPGLIAIILFFFGFFVACRYYLKNKKQPFKGFRFVAFIFLLSFFITIENPAYEFFYSLPVLNKITIVPAFVIFYIIPIVFFTTYGFSIILSFFSRFKLIKYLLVFAVPMLIFAEVLIGPSTFGNDTYSFNFAKMPYKTEITGFPHYNSLKDKQEGIYFIKDRPDIFLYPYSSALLNLKTLNDPTYFFGCRDDAKLANSDINEIKKRTNFIMTIRPSIDPDLKLIQKVSMRQILDHKSHSVFENMMDYLRLYEEDWNDDVFVYEVLCDNDCSLKNLSDNPFTFLISRGGGNSDNSKKVKTSINYSSWYKVYADGRKINIEKDDFGYIQLPPAKNYTFYYINYPVYLGFFISLGTFFVLLSWFIKKELRK